MKRRKRPLYDCSVGVINNEEMINVGKYKVNPNLKRVKRIVRQWGGESEHGGLMNHLGAR